MTIVAAVIAVMLTTLTVRDAKPSTDKNHNIDINGHNNIDCDGGHSIKRLVALVLICSLILMKTDSQKTQK